MPFYERGPIRIYYEEVGSGFPLLIAPDDVPASPRKVATEVASLAPNTQVTIYPWKDSQAHIDEVAEHSRRFPKAHEPPMD